MVMCAVLGWSQAEVADVLQVPRNTIANRIFRGRAKLAAQLGMTTPITGVRDPLVPTQGPVARFAVLAEDPVGESLTRAESWLRAGLEAEPDAGARIWAQVIESATAPEEAPGQPEPRRRLIGRLAPRRRQRDSDG
jgi:hypothetical protein